MVRARVTGVDVASHGSEYPCNPHTRLASCPRRHIPHGGRRWHSWTNMAEHARLQILIPSRDAAKNRAALTKIARRATSRRETGTSLSFREILAG